MSELSAGMAAQDVAALLNDKLGSGLVWCDGGPYDAHWLRTLFSISNLKPSFALGNWSALLLSLPDAHRESAMAALEAAPPRHRAGADAEQLMRALEAGLAATA